MFSPPPALPAGRARAESDGVLLRGALRPDARPRALHALAEDRRLPGSAHHPAPARGPRLGHARRRPRDAGGPPHGAVPGGAAPAPDPARPPPPPLGRGPL